MEFAEAVRQCVDTMGAGVVRDSRRFVSCLLDYADDSLALRAAARNLDGAALAPFVEVLDSGDGGSLGLACAKAEMTLRNERGLEASVAHDIASAIGGALAGVLAPPPGQEADARNNRTRQAGPAPFTEGPQPSQGNASQPTSQTHEQPSAAAPKGRTFLGHGFWWWYGVSFAAYFVLFLVAYSLDAAFFGSSQSEYLAILFIVPGMLFSCLTLWAVFVKLPIAIYSLFRSNKTK